MYYESFQPYYTHIHSMTIPYRHIDNIMSKDLPKKIEDMDRFFVRHAILYSTIGTGTGLTANYAGKRWWKFYGKAPFGIKLSAVGACKYFVI